MLSIHIVIAVKKLKKQSFTKEFTSIALENLVLTQTHTQFVKGVIMKNTNKDLKELIEELEKVRKYIKMLELRKNMSDTDYIHYNNLIIKMMDLENKIERLKYEN